MTEGKKDCKQCNGTGKLTPADMAACSDPDCCYQGDFDCSNCAEDYECKECLENAKIMGMSLEREYTLLGKIARLEKENESLRSLAGRMAGAIERWLDCDQNCDDPHTDIEESLKEYKRLLNG